MCPAKGQDRTETAPQGGKSQNSVQSAQPTSEQPHSMQQLAAHYLQRIRLKAWYVYRAYEPRPALLGLPASHACRTASSAPGQTAMPARPQQCTQAPPCTATCVLHQPGGDHTQRDNYTTLSTTACCLYDTPPFRHKHSDASSAHGATLGVPCNTHTPTPLLVTCHGHMLSSHPAHLTTPTHVKSYLLST